MKVIKTQESVAEKEAADENEVAKEADEQERHTTINCKRKSSKKKKREVIENKEQKKLGNHKMLGFEGTFRENLIRLPCTAYISHRRAISLTVTYTIKLLPTAPPLCCAFHLTRRQQQKEL